MNAKQGIIKGDERRKATGWFRLRGHHYEKRRQERLSLKDILDGSHSKEPTLTSFSFDTPTIDHRCSMCAHANTGDYSMMCTECYVVVVVVRESRAGPPKSDVCR
jgi:hypothetical protein